jgi:colanic acid biosynthesis glycosyl transferase WcaI
LKIIFIHTLHYSLDNRPVSRLYFDLVEKLISEGFSITVLTAKNGQSVKSMYGEKIIYINNYGYLKNSFIYRIFDYLSFYLGSFYFVNKCVNREKKSTTINLVKSGYGISSFISMIYKKLFKNHIVFWVLDRYPDIIISNKKQPFFTILKRLQIYSLNHFDKIVFETKSDRLDYYKNNGTSSSTVINTWSSIKTSIVNYSKPKFWDENDLDNKNIVVYSGNIGYSFDKEKLFKIAGKYPFLFFIILGKGSCYDGLLADLQKKLANNILLETYLPEEEYYYTIVKSLYGLVILKNGLDVFSSKITTYLSFNKPIIGAIDKSNEMYNLINNNCGVVLSDEYPEIPISGIKYDKYIINSKITKKLFNKNYNTNRFIRVLAS